MSILGRLSLFLTSWSERWVPSAYSIAAILTLIVLLAGIFLGNASLGECIKFWGDGLWLLMEFAMQMVLVMVTGYIVAVSPPLRRILDLLTSLFKTPTSAITALALLSMLLAWVNWGLGIVGSAVLARLVANKIRQLSLTLIVAVAYLGLGCTWHAGLSASAPLLIATPNHFLEKQIGIIPVTQTIFHPFNLALTLVVIITLTLFASQLPKSSPISSADRSAENSRFNLSSSPDQIEKSKSPNLTLAALLDHSYILNFVLGFLGLMWLVISWRAAEFHFSINTINFLFLFVGVLLHRNPQSVIRSSAEAAQFVHGIILQFPLYAGMFGIIQGTGLSQVIGSWFVAIASAKTLPVIVYWYSGFINYFVPSGGSKWAIEAPYIVKAAQDLGVPINKIALAYAWGDMATDLLQPFWAIPLITATGLEFRQILGYGILFWAVYFFLVTLAFAIFL
jgi:short-chain fatty acids transporter